MFYLTMHSTHFIKMLYGVKKKKKPKKTLTFYVAIMCYLIYENVNHVIVSALNKSNLSFYCNGARCSHQLAVFMMQIVSQSLY